MMKNVFALVLSFLFISSTVFGADGDFIVEGNIGIGVTDPEQSLQINAIDKKPVLIEAHKTVQGAKGAAVELRVTDSYTSGVKEGLNGLLVNYTHDGSMVSNHLASRVSMKLKGGGTSIYDTGKIAHSSSLTFMSLDESQGYSYASSKDYAFAMRAGLYTNGFTEKKHYFTNIGGLQVLHQYENSLHKSLSAENLYGIIISDISLYSSDGLDTVNNAGGILINKQTDMAYDGGSTKVPGGRISNLQGIWLKGDGAGADVVFGANKESKLYGNAGNIIIDTTGNVGIGTPGPGAKLQIDNGEGDPNGNEFLNHAFEIWGDDQMLDMGVSTANRVAYLQSVDVQTAYSNISLNPRGGNVGIGTTSPQATLDVNGTILTNGKGVIRSNQSVQQKMVVTSVHFVHNFENPGLQTINIQWDDQFSAQPIAAYVGNVTLGGGYAEVILSVSNISQNGADLNVYSPNPSRNCDFHINIVAIGAE